MGSFKLHVAINSPFTSHPVASFSFLLSLYIDLNFMSNSRHNTQRCNEYPPKVTAYTKPLVNDTLNTNFNISNEELHNMYASPNIIRIIESRRMRWAGNVQTRNA
jgi:hypothetical protein